MRRFRFPTIMAALTCCAVATGGCGTARYVTTAPQAIDPEQWPASRVTPHVVLVSIDGLRPDATVLWLLGVDEPEDWHGAPVLNAFEAASPAGS
jgi:hypothetical protein